MCALHSSPFSQRDPIFGLPPSFSLFSPLFVRGLFSLSLRVVTDEEEEDILFSPPGVCRPSGFFPSRGRFAEVALVCAHSASDAAAAYARQEAEEEERGHNIGLASLAPLRVIG